MHAVTLAAMRSGAVALEVCTVQGCADDDAVAGCGRVEAAGKGRRAGAGQDKERTTAPSAGWGLVQLHHHHSTGLASSMWLRCS
jgi:hypothetical protein